jgi:hypothetical protein
LALASGGGHWVQLMRLRPAFDGFEVAYVSMYDSYSEQVSGSRFHVIRDASRFERSSFLSVFVDAILILARERPTVIVTTGSAPMLIFVLLGRS